MNKVQKQNWRAVVVVFWLWLCACGFAYILRDPLDPWWVPEAFVSAVFVAMGVLAALITWVNTAEDD